jgi:hypothetical protein
MGDGCCMAREKTYSETLNLRIDPGLAREIERIAKRRGQSESETARSLLALGVDADRKIEAAWLRRPYDDDSEMIAVLDVHLQPFDPDDFGR